MALIATPGAANANSYITVAAASAYLDTRLDGALWLSTVIADQERALQTATRYLDDSVTWRGVIASQTQALAWPREAAYDQEGRAIDSAIIPTAIVRATAEYALYLLKVDHEGGLTPSSAGNVKSLRHGQSSIEYFDAAQATTVASVMPAYLLSMLRPYGYVAGDTIAKLRRA